MLVMNLHTIIMNLLLVMNLGYVVQKMLEFTSFKCFQIKYICPAIHK